MIIRGFKLHRQHKPLDLSGRGVLFIVLSCFVICACDGPRWWRCHLDTEGTLRWQKVARKCRRPRQQADGRDDGCEQHHNEPRSRVRPRFALFLYCELTEASMLIYLYKCILT
jgi:hypothetical protein